MTQICAMVSERDIIMYITWLTNIILVKIGQTCSAFCIHHTIHGKLRLYIPRMLLALNK